MGKEKENMDHEWESHPSYGMVRICRTCGHERPLFGSSIMHTQTVTMTISHGNVSRSLNADWYDEGTKIVTVEMSPTQFADMITCIGSATPCTINWEKGIGNTGEPPFTDRKSRFLSEESERLQLASEKMDALVRDAEDMLMEGHMNKSAREGILKRLQEIQSAMADRNEYLMHCFTEDMDRMVTEAKAEIEAFFDHRARTDAADIPDRHGVMPEGMIPEGAHQTGERM